MHTAGRIAKMPTLAAGRPDLAKDWHPTRNLKTPDQVSMAYETRVWWRCHSCEFEWQASPKCRSGLHRRLGAPSRETRGRDCIRCNSVGTLFPHLIPEWHRDNKKSVYEVQPGYHRSVQWTCSANASHPPWKNAVKNRTHRDQGCKSCLGMVATEDRNLSTERPDLVGEWHPTLNDSREPSSFTPYSNAYAYWQCQEGHPPWLANINNRRYTGCPYCTGNLATLETCLAATFPQIAAELHPLNDDDITVETLLPSSDKKVGWLCPAGHEYWASVHSRTGIGSGCPYCSGRRATPDSSLLSEFPKLCREWDDKRNRNDPDPDWRAEKNGPFRPNNLRPSSKWKVWWACSSCNRSWRTAVYNRTCGEKGCLNCGLHRRSKTEIRLAFELEHFLPIDVEAQRLELSSGVVEVDVQIPEHRVVVEYDSLYWHKDRHEQDRKKSRRLEEDGWRVIRVRELGLNPTGDLDVFVNRGENVKLAAELILTMISERLGIPVNGLEQYKKRRGPVAKKQANEFIRRHLKRP